MDLDFRRNAYHPSLRAYWPSDWAHVGRGALQTCRAPVLCDLPILANKSSILQHVLLLVLSVGLLSGFFHSIQAVSSSAGVVIG
jgi:hypothetical protein